MNPKLLNLAVQAYLREQAETDIPGIQLGKSPFPEISTSELVQQLQGRKIARKKLPSWYGTPGILYPPRRNLEQASSEATATYKASLAMGAVLDTTGGLGVDCLSFAKSGSRVTYIEAEQQLSDLASHNFPLLGGERIRCLNTDSLAWLERSGEQFDWIYADPSRRSEKEGRTFLLEAGVPDIPGNLELLFRHAPALLLKTSPLLDLKAGILALKGVAQIHVLALHNEVKELLWVVKSGFAGEPAIIAVNLKKKEREYFDFTPSREVQAQPAFSPPLTYLYEPNAAILKAGAFKLVGNRYGLYKLHPHSHLYTATSLVDFPGRRFHIEAVAPYSRKLPLLGGLKKANLSCRNFPQSVAALRKRHGIAEGGNTYLFFTKQEGEELVVLMCTKV